MSLNRDEVNALGILGFRKLSFIPSHFSKITTELKFDIKMLEQWIEYNLNSRYAVRNNVMLDQNRKMKTIIEIGIEDPKELTMLTLGCPYLYRKKD
jgi:hypothetical protein